MTPCEWLRAALANGPLDSREIKQLAEDQGITPKSLRIARENLGIHVSRSGCRAAMRSTWALGVADVPYGAKALSGRSARAREEASQATSQAISSATAEVLTFEPGRPPKSVDIDSLNEPSLRNYAAAIGVPRRDVENLTEDRLRQNCKLHLAHWFEMLSEG